jgi:CBS domain-containing protein
LSPRAACRLETLGFAEVYDYVLGKADWVARGLPTEGELAGEPRALSVLVDDVATCELGERVGDVRERVAASPYGFAFVVSGGRVLLGRLRRAALEGDPDATAEAAMEPGPSTIRAGSQLEPLLDRMRRNDLTCLPVTTPDGELMGLARRRDVERAVEATGSG